MGVVPGADKIWVVASSLMGSASILIGTLAGFFGGSSIGVSVVVVFRFVEVINTGALVVDFGGFEVVGPPKIGSGLTVRCAGS